MLTRNHPFHEIDFTPAGMKRVVAWWQRRRNVGETTGRRAERVSGWSAQGTAIAAAIILLLFAASCAHSTWTLVNAIAPTHQAGGAR